MANAGGNEHTIAWVEDCQAARTQTWDRLRLNVQDGVQELAHGATDKRRVAYCHLVEGAAKGPQVRGKRVVRPLTEQLRGHVGRASPQSLQHKSLELSQL